MNENITERLSMKTPEQQFLNKLEQEFEFAPRVAEAILQEAKVCLLGPEEPIGSGQKRVILAKRGARHGRPLREVEKVEVFWTVDAGAEDMAIGKREGAMGLRRARIERLLTEAVEQGAAATQEDLAWALNVDARTIRRDCDVLQAEGKEVPTRGNLQGIGRGQTHKRQILGRWLAGETYDQITLQCHHNAASVARYIQGFVRVVHLIKEGFSLEEVAMLLPMSRSLVAEYLAVYAENDTALAHRRLTDHRRRITKGVPGAKRGKMNGQAYVGSGKRTFRTALANMLAKDYALVGSRRVREMIVDDVMALVEQFFPPAERMRPGWVVYTGTKASGKKAYPGQEGGDHELVTIPWPLLLPEDVTTHIEAPPGELGKEKLRQLLRRRLVRLVEHGLQHEQGPVLLTQADLGLLLGFKTEQISQLLVEARQETGKPLMTKGYYFDQGMRPTHKAQIIALYESGVDEADIARRSHHSPQSVGRYIRDYERVKLLVERQIALEEMAPLTGMTPGVTKAHWKLLHEHRPDLFEKNGLNVPSST